MSGFTTATGFSGALGNFSAAWPSAPPPHWNRARKTVFYNALRRLGQNLALNTRQQRVIDEAKAYWQYVDKWGHVPPAPLGPNTMQRPEDVTPNDLDTGAAAEGGGVVVENDGASWVWSALTLGLLGVGVYYGGSYLYRKMR